MESKIRILWIDDRELDDGLPESSLPGVYQQYFEVCHPSSTATKCFSFESAGEIAPVIQAFWQKGNTDILPVEVIATDYNLQKSSAAVSAPGSAPPIFLEPEEITAVVQNDADQSDASEKVVNFHGLLVGIFYAALTHAHPAAIVSITNYRNKMPSEVTTLQKLATPFLGVDFDFNLNASERSWDRIICEAMPHLRRRIEVLDRQDQVIISLGDLMALSANPAEHNELTVTSRFATRKLPVKGLFIDVPEESFCKEVRQFAETLLLSKCGKQLIDAETGEASCHEFFRRALAHAKEITDAYRDIDRIERRHRLSAELKDLTDQEVVDLVQKLESGDVQPSDSIAELWKQFRFTAKITGRNEFKTSCTEGCTDVFGVDCPDSVRRWVVIFVLYNFLSDILLARKRRSKELRGNSNWPILKLTDFIMALYPVPIRPVKFPWHKGRPLDGSHTWLDKLENMKDEETQESLRIDVSHCTDGEHWDPSNQIFGLKRPERLVLQGLVQDSADTIPISAWRDYSPAERFVYGKSDTGR